MPPYTNNEQSLRNSEPMTTVGNSLKASGPQDQISMEMNQLDECTNYLLDRIALLRIRLGPVLLESNEKNPDGGAVPQPSLSPIAGAIRHQRSKTVDATRVINELLAQLSI